ncbi:type II toxin-antitoxin system PemK/MazF family toxin [Paenibacillus polysaccharolyticus]|nr:type II toxin-antitoxin system PemK/MazF family toxin [Paenibacillus polysaccharolyticus]
MLIVSNDMGNRHSPTVQVASVTSVNKKDMPTHVKLNASECGLLNDSTVLFEQMTTIQKDQLLWRIGNANTYVPQLDRALLVQLGCINAWE